LSIKENIFLLPVESKSGTSSVKAVFQMKRLLSRKDEEDRDVILPKEVRKPFANKYYKLGFQRFFLNSLK